MAHSVLIRSFVAFLLGSSLGCATTYRDNPSLLPEKEVEQTVTNYSQEIQKYDGFENVLSVGTTLLNSKVKLAVVDQKARVYEMSDEQRDKEKKTAEDELVKKTEIFISFFTPSKKQDDLAKPKSVWKIFLDSGGKRYEGKATKIKAEVAEMRAYYPYHNRWSTPYLVSFDVPTPDVEINDSKLTLTGPVGSASFNFKKME